MRHTKISLAIGACLVTYGCASNEPKSSGAMQSAAMRQAPSAQQAMSNSAPESAPAQTVERAQTGSPAYAQTDLLPPNAKAGECYARVWVEPTYDTKSKTIVVQEASQSINIIPAEYEWSTESVMVEDASSQIIEIPAQYESVQEKILVENSRRMWVSDLKRQRPVSSSTLNAAKMGGIDLDNAEVNMCYHEHVVPAETKTVTQSIEVAPATFSIATTQPEYRTVEKRMLKKEASKKIIEVPAKYDTFTEQVLDKPAHTIWKKGTGPIQKMDQATGEIMCLVEVPATYKTVTRRKLESPATTQVVEIPAEYETIKIKELVSAAGEQRTDIPAQFKTVEMVEEVSPATFVWHEVHDNTMSAKSRTGSQVCLIETPERYDTITRKVISTPASTRAVEIPAKYSERKIKKLVTAAREVRNDIPAVEKTVTYSELDKDGYMDWRSILCQTNMTPGLISRLQSTLNSKGYDAGDVDGQVGAQTIAAVNEYQADNELPTDQYLNIQTLRSLGVL